MDCKYIKCIPIIFLLIANFEQAVFGTEQEVEDGLLKVSLEGSVINRKFKDGQGEGGHGLLIIKHGITKHVELFVGIFYFQSLIVESGRFRAYRFGMKYKHTVSGFRDVDYLLLTTHYTHRIYSGDEWEEELNELYSAISAVKKIKRNKAVYLGLAFSNFNITDKLGSRPYKGESFSDFGPLTGIDISFSRRMTFNLELSYLEYFNPSAELTYRF